jgi:hypothetical protein
MTHWNGTVLDYMWLSNRTELIAVSRDAARSLDASSESVLPLPLPLVLAAVPVPSVMGSSHSGVGRFLVSTAVGVYVASMPAPSIARVDYDAMLENKHAEQRASGAPQESMAKTVTLPPLVHQSAPPSYSFPVRALSLSVHIIHFAVQLTLFLLLHIFRRTSPTL